MVETMRREGHKALVHTAAASNLGQMLNRICLKDGIDLVNIVRSPAQEKLLRDLGAKYVCDFHRAELHGRPHRGAGRHRRDAGLRRHRGGRLQGQILSAMEVMAVKAIESTAATARPPTSRSMSMAAGVEADRVLAHLRHGWGMGGWLLFPFLQKIAPPTPAFARAGRRRTQDHLRQPHTAR